MDKQDEDHPKFLGLGDFLKQKRSQKTVSIELAAEKIGVDRSGLARIEAGKTSPRTVTLNAIFDYYGTDIDEFRQYQSYQQSVSKISEGIENDDESGRNRHTEHILENLEFFLGLGLSGEQLINGLRNILISSEEYLNKMNTEILESEKKLKQMLDEEAEHEGGKEFIRIAISAFERDRIVNISEARRHLEKVAIVCRNLSSDNSDRLLGVIHNVLSGRRDAPAHLSRPSGDPKET